MSNYIIDDINISSYDSDRKNSDYSDQESSNEQMRCVGKYKKLLLLEIKASLFILCLGLKGLLCRQNQQSFCVIFFILRLITKHPGVWGIFHFTA